MPQKKPRSHRTHLETALVAVIALVVVAARVVPGHAAPRRVTALPRAVAALLERTAAPGDSAARRIEAEIVAAQTAAAVDALEPLVRSLSDSHALDAAFRSYFAFRNTHPADVTKPYLYFVDYGLPSTEPRGYVFDMQALKVIDGPFTVAHGRGSSESKDGIPTRFSNAFGSMATSLGLYLAQELYAFRGNSGGRHYASVGLRLEGVSPGFNDNARARRVVAHGAPYVTASKAGRSEGCPAMEPARARRLLPELARGGMVFLFAPDREWMSTDRWLSNGG